MEAWNLLLSWVKHQNQAYQPASHEHVWNVGPPHLTGLRRREGASLPEGLVTQTGKLRHFALIPIPWLAFWDKDLTMENEPQRAVTAPGLRLTLCTFTTLAPLHNHTEASVFCSEPASHTHSWPRDSGPLWSLYGHFGLVQTAGSALATYLLLRWLRGAGPLTGEGGASRKT